MPDQEKEIDSVGKPEMSDDDRISERIIESIRKAVYQVIVDAASKDESLVVADKDGNFSRVPAKELLKRIN